MMEDQSTKWRVHLMYVIIFITLAGFIFSYSLQLHKKQDAEVWKAENFADQGGYFIYNPIWFDYGYQSANFPEKMDSLMGMGFSLSTPVIKNKYTCGVAYLQTPFYLWAKIDAKLNHRGSAFTSKQIKRSIDAAAIFYMLMGALLLYFLLTRFFKPFVSFISIVLVIGGTNIFYYGVYHPGMSHIYSFFLYSAALFLADLFFEKNKKWMLVLLSLAVACIILIRPINIFFLPAILFIRGSVKQNIRLLLKPVHILIILIASVWVFAPQMYYWHIFSGKFIYYSYNEEGFTHLKDPVFIRVLFAPENGLIPYSLMYIILLVANIYAIIKKQAFAIYYLVYQLIALYLVASWHAPAFGASYGQRNFVEVFVGLIFIFAFMLSKIINIKKNILLAFVLIISSVFCFANFKIMSRYDMAFFGTSPWDWKEYKYFLSFAHYTDTENFNHYYRPEYVGKNGKNHFLHISSERDFTRTLLVDCKDFPAYFKRGVFSMDLQSDEKMVEFFYCLEVAKSDSTIMKEVKHVKCEKLGNSKWRKAQGTFFIKKLSMYDLKDSKMIFFIWNAAHYKFNVDNAKISIK